MVNLPSESDISPALPSDLKEQNRRIVLGAFRDNQEHTAAEISAQTGISKITVKRAIQFFCAGGILKSCGKGMSTEYGGKKPELFRLCRIQYLMNITVWPETLFLTLFDLSGEALASVRHSWQIPADTKEAFSVIRRLSDQLMEKVGVERSLLFGVNFSTAGIVNYANLVLKYNTFAPGWGTDIPVGEYLREIFPEVSCISVENTGKTISRTVRLNPEYANHRTLVLFTSWGISAAFLKNGHIENGRDSLIGEIGHMTIDPHEVELCRCGSRGCLEQEVDMRRIQRRLRLKPPPEQSPLAAIAPEKLTLHDLFEASRTGDVCAREYVRNLAACFAVMLKNVAVSFNPESIVFVGDYADADEYFEQCIRDRIAAFHYLPDMPFTFSYDDRPLEVLDATGGANILIDSFFSRECLYMDAQPPAM